MYNWAANKLKLQRAIALGGGDEARIYELYVKFGGYVNPGHDLPKKEQGPIENVVGEFQESNIKPAEDGLNPRPKENIQLKIKRRGRPKKNAS